MTEEQSLRIEQLLQAAHDLLERRQAAVAPDRCRLRKAYVAALSELHTALREAFK